MDVNAFKRSGHREIVLHLISLCLEIRRLFAALENASSKTTVTGPSPTDDILLQPTASTLGQDPMTTTNQINKCLWTFADWLLLPSMLDDAVQRLIITEEDNTNLTHPWFCFLTLPFDGMSIPQVKLVRALVLIRHFPPIKKLDLTSMSGCCAHLNRSAHNAGPLSPGVIPHCRFPASDNSKSTFSH